MPYDLFGEIPVTDDDVFLWVQSVAPRWLSSERSFRGYVKNYDVAGKIRMAKLRGVFDQITNNPHRIYHARLALSAIV